MPIKKHTYKYVKEFIEKENYQLLSTEYKNCMEKLILKCDKGHKYKVKFNNFKSGKRCPICDGNQKLTYNFVKNFIKKEGCVLLSTKYTNNFTKLEIQCPKNHIFKMRFNNFRRGSRCPDCSKNKKLTFEYVKEYIEKENYILLSTKYLNCTEELKVKCNKGHEYKTIFSYFKTGNRCPICNLSKITSKGEKEVLNYVQYIYSGKIIENDRNIILNPLTKRNLELDIYLPEINKAIEYNGDYYHSNHRSVIIDKIKANQCKKLNIDLLIIKESEWKNNNDGCLNKIKEFI